MYVLGLLKNQTAVHIADMARECGVSERTVYRDISSLIKLGFVVQYRDGYKLTPDADLPQTSLSGSEVALVNYCLRTNALAAHPYFRRRFAAIEQKLRGFAGGADRDDERAVEFESSKSALNGATDPDLLAEFFRALQQRRKIRIKSKDAGANGGDLYTPISVGLRHQGQVLKVADDQGRVVEYVLDSLAWIGVTDVPYRRPAAADQASSSVV
ncbi:MAG TPA: HTH domain-containing protein [candidate division Zixibacteria bacterium]|nr:HTH domain-containing protein [candidate division Zixibacteria bacterium]